MFTRYNTRNVNWTRHTIISISKLNMYKNWWDSILGLDYFVTVAWVETKSFIRKMVRKKNIWQNKTKQNKTSYWLIYIALDFFLKWTTHIIYWFKMSELWSWWNTAYFSQWRGKTMNSSFIVVLLWSWWVDMYRFFLFHVCGLFNRHNRQ